MLFYIALEEMTGQCVLQPENDSVQDVMPGKQSLICTAEGLLMKSAMLMVFSMLWGAMMGHQVSIQWSVMTLTQTSGFM